MKQALLSLLLVPLSLAAQEETTPAWQNFEKGNADNVLLDFSYAGYHHATKEPADVYTLGYTVYNVEDYGAVANDEKSDRAALEAIAKKIGRKTEANAIIYFPEGRFILHGPEDDTTDSSGKKASTAINLVMGHVIIKGAGRDRTTLAMTAPMQPTNAKVLYSSPIMFSLRNNGVKDADLKIYANVTSTAKKNAMSLTVDDASKLHAGDWVCLHLLNADEKVVKAELNGLTVLPSMTNLKAGVEVVDYHQIKSVSGHTVTFEEPIMHAVNPAEGWVIREYRHYEEVGVEDLTFEGRSTEYFHHHQSWEDDGAYKPLNFVRLVNSWLRRVNFKSVSEAMTVQDCANVSCYDVEISGNRGHSAIRMANSSRGFIANVWDHSDGYLNSDTKFKQRKENLGQYHACGVSKHAIGNVIYNCLWGDDACFESHATQPRATLFDDCKGGFMQLRMGGDKSQLPNHLDDLTLWNFECTVTNPTEFPFEWWWPDDNKWYKTMPPTLVGFHGTEVSFEESQIKLNENQNLTVSPFSLFEAQLQRRLGYLPDWLQRLDKRAVVTMIAPPVCDKKVTRGKERPAVRYDLSGRRVTGTYRGLVVADGMKWITR